MGDGEPIFFKTAAAFRRWLAKNAHREQELVVGFRKVGTGEPSMTWSESVDEALCFGWIDGVRKRIDDASYRIRFTPRKPGSIWSTINIAKVEALVAAGKMRPAGAAAFARRSEHRSGIYSYEHDGEVALDAAELRAFKASKPAWRWFEAAAPGYRRKMLFRVVKAKRPETRARRLAKLIAACAEGKLLE